MKKALFSELMASAAQALEHAQGKRELRTSVLPPLPGPISAARVRRLRKRLNASQAVFARYLNVSTKLVQAWEADRRTPAGSALVLLRLGEHDPTLLPAATLACAGRNGVQRVGPSTGVANAARQRRQRKPG